MANNSGRRIKGFPSNNIKGNDWQFNPGCGGSGAGECHTPANFSYIYWPIKVNPFSMHNSKLVIHNDTFTPRVDSGSNSLCPHNAGDAVDFDLLLMYTEPTGSTPDRSKATVVLPIPASNRPPYDIEFEADHLPQPDNPSYERKIWAVVDMKQTGRMIGGIAQQTEVMNTIKINWEGQP